MKKLAAIIATSLFSFALAEEPASVDPIADMIRFLEKHMVSSAKPTDYENTPAGARKFAIAFAEGNREMILSALPTQEEIRMICATPEDAALVERYVEQFRTSIPATGLGKLRKPEQTEVQIISSSTDALLNGIEEGLPGGYYQTAQRYRRGLSMYAFRFVKPGESLGMRYDVCVFVNGRMVFIPKMWRAFP